MSTLNIKFTGTKEVGDHIEYIIHIDNPTNEEKIEFSHRYSYLRSIHTTLKKFSPSLQFPRRKLFGNRNSKFLETRKTALENYFSKVFCDIELMKILKTLKFIKPDLEKKKVEKNGVEKNGEKGLCCGCVNAKCWEIVNNIGDMYVDMSCHPGSISEEDVLFQQESILEGCKDIKFEYAKSMGNDSNIEFLSNEKSRSDWISKALDICTDELHVRSFNLFI